VELLQRNGVDGLSASQVQRTLREFDIDHTSVITREEFKSFLRRIRMSE